jgi:putative ABC transport system permease protein
LGPGEVAVTSGVRRSTAAGIDDSIELLRGGRLRVTGVIEHGGGPGDDTIVVGRPFALPPIPRASPGEGYLFVDLPSGSALHMDDIPPTWRTTRREVMSSIGDPERSQMVTDSYGVAAIALVLTGTVVAAAFAVGARRHLRTLGLLAANGVPSAGLRRVMVLQGAVTGAVGSALGVALAVGVAKVVEPHLPALAHWAVGPVVIRPLDLAGAAGLGVVAATLAAWWPAVTASRVPVLAALAGRRPQRAVHPNVPRAGLLLAAAGIGGIAAGGLGRVAAFGVVLAIFAGGALSTPWLVSRFEPLSARARGALRVAARGLARNRLRTCAVATAMMAPMAVATLVFTVADSRGGAPDDPPLRSDQVLGTSTRAPVPTAAEMRPLRAALPQAVSVPIRRVANPRDPDVALDVVWRGRGARGADDVVESTVAVATPALLDALATPAATAGLLDDGAVVALRPVPDRLAVHDRNAPFGGPPLFRRADVVVADPDAPVHRWLPDFLVSPAWAEARGLPTVDVAILVRNPEPLTAAERRAVARLAPRVDPDADIRNYILAAPLPSREDTWFQVAPRRSQVRTLAVAAVGGAVLVFALLVVAVTLALNAAESQDERDLMASLGAPPRALRSAAGWQAVLLPLSGAVVGVPLGLASAAAVLWALARDDGAIGQNTLGGDHGFGVPWLLLVTLLVVVPLASGAVARLVAGVTSRRRRPLVAALAAD